MTRRLLWSYLTITLFVLLLLELPLGVFYAQREQDRQLAGAASDAAVLATFVEDSLESTGPVESADVTAYARRTGTRVVVVRPDGISVLDTDQAIGRDFSTRPEIVGALAGHRESGLRHSNTLDSDILFVATPVASGGTVHGALRITVDTHYVTDRVHRFWWYLAGTAAVALAAVALIGWWLARSVTRPIRELHETAGRIAAGDFTPTPLTHPTVPELTDLADAMNMMATRVERLVSEQRSFVADASHQLRTPLTALRLRLENLESSLEPFSAETAEEAAALNQEVQRLATIVSDLLYLARTDAPLATSVVDIRQIVRDRCDTWTALADSSGVQLHRDLPPGSLMVVAASGAIEQVLDNLLDNAVTICSPRGEVWISLRTDGEAAALTVADDGPGLTEEERANATKRFWRKGHDRSGSGLGLAIVLALVNASGGSLRLEESEAGGLAVTARFATSGASHSAPPSASQSAPESPSVLSD